MVDIEKYEKPLPIVVITGPTATGKTHLAVQLAAEFQGEIISVDSRQVYRRLDIGTGKDLAEYCINGQNIKHHLIDIVEPDEEFNLKEFCSNVWKTVSQIETDKKLPIFCGGSTMYLDALLNQYTLPGGQPDIKQRHTSTGKSIEELQLEFKKISPEAYDRFKDKNNRARLLRAIEINNSTDIATQITKTPQREARYLIIGIYLTRTEVHLRIEKRLNDRFNTGMIDEIAELHHQGLSWERLEFLGLEYRYIAQHLQGKISYEEMRLQLLYKIRQFAKRQDIWFRKMEREGKTIYWIKNDKDILSSSIKLIRGFLAGDNLPPSEIMLKNINYGKISQE